MFSPTRRTSGAVISRLIRRAFSSFWAPCICWGFFFLRPPGLGLKGVAIVLLLYTLNNLLGQFVGHSLADILHKLRHGHGTLVLGSTAYGDGLFRLLFFSYDNQQGHSHKGSLTDSLAQRLVPVIYGGANFGII